MFLIFPPKEGFIKISSLVQSCGSRAYRMPLCYVLYAVEDYVGETFDPPSFSL